MEESLVALLLVDMSSALFTMHKNNMIHRDIKPENIFVNNTGSFKVRVEEIRADGIKVGAMTWPSSYRTIMQSRMIVRSIFIHVTTPTSFPFPRNSRPRNSRASWAVNAQRRSCS
eukprot:631598-Pyramimonas_sp.AAC.1